MWDKLERIVGYRVTDANQEQAFRDANRRPLVKLYDECKAAKRTVPQVLVRYGIGQVLAVGGFRSGDCAASGSRSSLGGRGSSGGSSGGRGSGGT